MRTLSVGRWSLRSAVATSMLLLIGAGASAASIDWLPRIDASTNLPVNNGNVIEAVNSGGLDVTINGIDFVAGDFGDDIFHSNLVDSFPECCSDNGAPTGVNADMEFMLDSHRWQGGGPRVATLALEDLTPGDNYMIQVYFSDFRSGSFKEYVWAGDNASTSEVFRRGTTEDNWSFIGNFTADTDKQRVLLIPLGTRLDGFENHDAGLSGYVLSAVPGGANVPEPSSLVFVMMAVVGILARRQRWAPRSSVALGMVVFGMVLMIGPARTFAAEINWLPRIDASTNLPVNNSNVIEAVNSGGLDVTINGIEFIAGDFGDDILHSNLVDSFPECCSDNGAPTGVNEDMEFMLDSHRWRGGGASVATLRLEDLTPGDDYMIQVYFSDFRPGSFKEYFWMDDLGNSSEIFRRGTTEDNWSFIGEFTADVEMQNVHLVPDGTRLDGFENHDSGLSGYVLSFVPPGLDGDCNGDGVVDAQDLACVSDIPERDIVLDVLNTLPGDLNGNGDVAFADFLTLSANFGADGLGYIEGNIDLAGAVEFADFLVLSANFGKTPVAGATASAVPEPSSWALLALGGLVMWRRRR